MYRVRHYGEAFHPDHFKEGVRGWYIVLLNWVRWKIETYVQRQVVKFLTTKGSLPRVRVKELLRTFDLDVRAENLQKEQTSPLHDPPPEESNASPRVRAERYVEGRKASLVESITDDSLPVRPTKLDNLIGRYAFEGRAKKYGKGRRYLGNPDGDFEPLEEEAHGGFDNDSHRGAGGARRGSNGRGGSDLEPVVPHPEDRRHGSPGSQ